MNSNHIEALIKSLSVIASKRIFHDLRMEVAKIGNALADAEAIKDGTKPKDPMLPRYDKSGRRLCGELADYPRLCYGVAEFQSSDQYVVCSVCNDCLSGTIPIKDSNRKRYG